jgi:hypothetical protein
MRSQIDDTSGTLLSPKDVLNQFVDNMRNTIFENVEVLETNTTTLGGLPAEKMLITYTRREEDSGDRYLETYIATVKDRGSSNSNLNKRKTKQTIFLPTPSSSKKY